MNGEGGSDVPRATRPRSTAGPPGSRRVRALGVLLAAVLVIAAVLAVPRIREMWHARLRDAGGQGASKDRVEPPVETGRSAPRGGEMDSGAELYAAHCTACHGDSGDGRGRAARYLFPRPRDFGAGGLQMASTSNGVASQGDVAEVLARGMPGTSMQAFDALSPDERTLLAQEVLRLRREGARRQITRAMQEAGEEAIEAEVRDDVERTTTPGGPVPLPDPWPRSDDAVASGQAAYRALGCDKCHGDDGAGAEGQSWFDAQGEPNRPRDLAHEPFKGGRERESIYLRIAVGMPGTAHPGAPGLPREQLADLVEYVLSLARLPSRVLTNHERRVHADTRAYRDWLGQ